MTEDRNDKSFFTFVITMITVQNYAVQSLIVQPMTAVISNTKVSLSIKIILVLRDKPR